MNYKNENASAIQVIRRGMMIHASGKVGIFLFEGDIMIEFFSSDTPHGSWMEIKTMKKGKLEKFESFKRDDSKDSNLHFYSIIAENNAVSIADQMFHEGCLVGEIDELDEYAFMVLGHGIY